MTRFQGKLDSEFELFLTIPGVVQLLFKFHGQAMIGWSSTSRLWHMWNVFAQISSPPLMSARDQTAWQPLGGCACSIFCVAGCRTHAFSQDHRRGTNHRPSTSSYLPSLDEPRNPLFQTPAFATARHQRSPKVPALSGK